MQTLHLIFLAWDALFKIATVSRGSPGLNIVMG